MSYTITKSDGTILTTINDSSADGLGFPNNNTNLTLPGPNLIGYGEYLVENLVYLLENFAGNSAPARGPNLEGQLWFNKSTQSLNVFTNQGYLPVSGITTSSVQPATSKDGDIWFNRLTNQMFLRDSGIYNLIGPQYTKSMGVSGAIPEVVNDGSTSGVTHNIIKLQFGNLILATLSADSTFTPQDPIPGFTYINPGITLSSNITGAVINTNVVGNLTGDVVGNLTGNVIATTLVGNLTGDVVGNLTGNVIATTLVGNLTGDTTSGNITVTNLKTGNAQITGGSITGLTNLSATTAQATNFSSANAQVVSANIASLSSNLALVTNFSSGNVVITGGSARGLAITNGSAIDLTNLTATAGQVTNLTTSNATITGGNVSAVAIASSTVVNSPISGSTGQFTTAVATNFSTANAQITSGNVTGLTNLTVTGATLTNLSTTTAVATNFSTANAQITSGNVTGLTNLTVTNGTITILGAANFSSSNVQITSGNIAGLVNLTATNITSSNVSISGGRLNGTSLGVTTPSTGAFTALSASGLTNITNSTASTSASSGALVIAGGVGIGGAVNITGAVTANQFNGSGAGLTGTASSLTSGAASSVVGGYVSSINGSTGSVTVRGLGIGGETWHAVTRSFNTQYTNSYSYPIAVSATATCAVTSEIHAYVDGVLIAWYQWQFNGCGSFGGTFIIVPPGSTYQLNSGQGVYQWKELY